MKQVAIIFLMCFLTGSISAQNTHGTIKFIRTTNWTQIYTKLPFLSEEEKSRRELTGSWFSGRGEEYELHFTNNKSLYQRVEEPNTSGYNWRRDQYLLIRDHKKARSNDQVDLLGKTYIIEDDSPKYKWKILNEIKEIAGFLCMKAETKDTIKGHTIYAWFTNQIPVQTGPEGYDGLPGMILGIEVNDGDVIVEADKVVFEADDKKLPIPKKMKGKNITRVEFNQKVSKYIADSIEGERNPYWRVRY